MMRQIVFLVLLIVYPTAYADHRGNEYILPLSMAVGVGMIPGKTSGDTHFNYSRQVELSTLYRVYKNFGLGIGFNLMSRNFDYQNGNDEYSIDTLFTQLKWHPHYHASKLNYYFGGKANIHVVLYGEVGGLDSEDEDSVALGFEPLIGVLLPFFYPHVFLDLSLSYQWRKYPSLYHEPPDQRRRNVDDSNVILQAQLRF